MNHFKDKFFLVTPLHEDSHAKIFVIETELEYRCMNLFCKFLSHGHFLMGNKLYVYKEVDLSQEDLYLKKQLFIFFKELGFLQDEASRKLSKRIIKNRLLLDDNSEEESKVIFGKLAVSLSFYVFYICLYYFLTIYQPPYVG